MIIDSTNYKKQCSCGKVHTMETALAVIEPGCLLKIEEYLEKFGLTGYRVAVYDENTYQASDGKHPKADMEVILDPTDLHANEHGVELLMDRLPQEAKVLIAVGSGTIHDITRYCAWKIQADFVSCPTAASVDGFCSSVAAMTWHGCKKTMTAVAPRFVLADTEIIKNAPVHLAKSGFGDMIGKYIALTDWKIANILTDEFYCEEIARMTEQATKEVLDSAEGIINGDEKSYEKLTYGLILSGLAMQMFGNSRPASGAEHHISHIIQMSPKGLDVSSDALHGEKVGVATIIAAREYHRIAKLCNVQFKDYEEYVEEYIEEMFGDELTEEILKENEKDCALSVKAAMLYEKFKDICKEIEKVPSDEYLTALYEKLRIKSKPEDIDVPADRISKLIEYSPCVRNRITLMRLRKCIK